MSRIITNSHQKLGINEILIRLKELAILPETKIKIENLMVCNDQVTLQNELSHVDEAFKVVMRHERAPFLIESMYTDILSIAYKGGKLTGLEIYETAKLFLTIKANIRYISNLKAEKNDCKYYDTLVSQLYINDYLYNRIVNAIDENGYVLDAASPTLKQIRHKLSIIDQRIKSKCQELLTKESDKLSQPSIVMRNDCYCLAVKNDYKNSIRGVIQDYSSSMQTVYIEPEAVNILNREKTILFHQEHEEIEKILKEISENIQNSYDELYANYTILQSIDFIFAKAVLAIDYDGRMPLINKDGILNLVNARHPLLKVKKVIPNNINFDKLYDGIIITGPNTGGKTVMLKTIGLLVLMTKYGLLIPASEQSNIMLYDDVYCDIGDDQSIENNLSTFSSHMNNIVDIINHVTPQSLVLFDEIGAGTDPIEGSNLAIAILKYLLDHEISFIATTHYSELKAFGYEEERIINASMEFDQNTLSPTYHLLIGTTGSSNALNIASRLGLKDEIVKKAEDLMISKDTNVHKLIIKLEQLVQENEIKKLNFQTSEQELSRQKEELTLQLNQIEIIRQDIIRKAEKSAQEIIFKAKQDGEAIITNMQEKLNQDLKLHEVIEFKRQLNELDVNKPKPKTEIINDPHETLKVGDDVYLASFDQYGTISKITKKGTYQIDIGTLKLECEKSEIKKIKNHERFAPSIAKTTLASPKPRVSLVLDLRGERYLEAKDKLDKYIDDLVCGGIKQATIIHGYGTGTIRELVQKYLKKSPFIESFRYGGESEGGFGVTIITLK